MGDDLLKKTGVGNLFMVFGEPDIELRRVDRQVVVELHGMDVFDPTTGEIRSSSTDDISCWSSIRTIRGRVSLYTTPISRARTSPTKS